MAKSQNSEIDLCQEVESRLVDAPGFDLESSQLGTHLESCSKCREQVESYQKTVALVRDLPPARVPEDFLSWVQAAVANEPAASLGNSSVDGETESVGGVEIIRARESGFGSSKFAYAAAALLCIGVGLYGTYLAGGFGGSAPGLAGRQDPPQDSMVIISTGEARAVVDHLRANYRVRGIEAKKSDDSDEVWIACEVNSSDLSSLQKELVRSQKLGRLSRRPAPDAASKAKVVEGAVGEDSWVAVDIVVGGSNRPAEASTKDGPQATPTL